MKSGFKSGFVSILGKTNVGKSTFINTVIGEKVASVTNKPQTTRTLINGILNKENAQIIFIDTPGMHKPKNKLGKLMIDNALKAGEDVDVILFIIDVKNEIDIGNSKILEKIKELDKPTILLINKIDIIKKEQILKTIDLYAKEYNFSSIIPISAKNYEDTKTVIEEIEKLLPYGDPLFEKDEYTNQTERQLVEEIIREKALILLREEIPHGILIEIENMKLRKTKEKLDIYDIEANIYCEKKSHKSIIIGKNGSMLKKIGELGRLDSEKVLGTKVNLKLWVKVREDWLNKEEVIRRLK